MKSNNWSWKEGPWETLHMGEVQVAGPISTLLTKCELRDVVIANLQTTLRPWDEIPESFSTTHVVRGNEILVRTWPFSRFTEIMFCADDPLC